MYFRARRLLPFYLMITFVFYQIMKAESLYAAGNWQGLITVNNQTIWSEQARQNFFVSVLNLGVDDQIFTKNRLSLNLFLPYRHENMGATSYSPSVTASIIGNNYSLFTNYGVFTTSDQLLGSKESKREQVGLNIFPDKLPSVFISYNKNEEVKSFSGGKGPVTVDLAFNSNYTFKGIALSGGYREQENKDAAGKLTFRNKGYNLGTATTLQILPMTSITASYDIVSNQSENFSTQQESSSTSDTISLHISTQPFEWVSASGSYLLTNAEQDIKISERKNSTVTKDEGADTALTLIPYPKLYLRIAEGFKKQKQNVSKTVDFTSYGISYDTMIIRNIDTSYSLTRTLNDDSIIGKTTTDVFSFSSNMLLHPLIEARLGMSISKNELPEITGTTAEKKTTGTFSNSWTIGIVSYPTDKVNLNIDYQTGGTSEKFSILKTVSQSANINLRYNPKADVSYNVSCISSFGGGGNQTTLTGSTAYKLMSGSTITLSYSSKFGEISGDSFGGQLFFNLRKATTIQINYGITPFFVAGGASSNKFLGIVITKRLL